MEKLKYMIVMAVFTSMVFVAHGQNILPQYPPFSIQKKKPVAVFNPPLMGYTQPILPIHSVLRQLSPMGSYVHYPALFCTMEQKSAHTLGVFVKVHAGDYDTYMRRQK